MPVAINGCCEKNVNIAFMHSPLSRQCTEVVTFSVVKFLTCCTAGAGGMKPTPESERLSGLVEALVVNLSVSARLPVVVGVNVTETEQEFPAASVEPQVMFVMA